MIDYSIKETKPGEWMAEYTVKGRKISAKINANNCEEYKRNPKGFFLKIIENIERDIALWEL